MLLGVIGDAEMKQVIEKTANRISKQKHVLLDAKKSIDLDESELKKIPRPRNSRSS